MLAWHTPPPLFLDACTRRNVVNVQLLTLITQLYQHKCHKYVTHFVTKITTQDCLLPHAGAAAVHGRHTQQVQNLHDTTAAGACVWGVEVVQYYVLGFKLIRKVGRVRMCVCDDVSTR